MIHLQTRCPACATEFAWETYASLQRQGSFFVVPPLAVVRCPNCNQVSLPGETLPLLSLSPLFLNEEDYTGAISRHFGVLPDGFRMMLRYAIGNGNEIALCTMYTGTFFLIFLSHTGDVDITKIAGVAEQGAREKVQAVASIIGATKIEA